MLDAVHQPLEGVLERLPSLVHHLEQLGGGRAQAAVQALVARRCHDAAQAALGRKAC